MSKKIIKLSEKDLHNIIKESVEKIIHENYKMDSVEDVLEYMWLKPKLTNLNVDIFVDDGGAYIRHKHELLLLVRNSYDKSINEFIPISVSKDPIILDDDNEFNISYNDIFDVQDFIVANLNLLEDLANRKISQISFAQSISSPSYSLSEEKMVINEMSTLKKEDTNLPMDIWVDETATFQGHAPRLKFRASRDQRTTREFSSMLLTNPPKIENFPNNSPLRKRDIEKLEIFVLNNLEILLKLAYGEIDFLTEFLPRLKLV
ncbi:MAG: hypothetical protein IKT40_12535 [Bacilli bacterium]|nr:hypothetical protein [Bacilli bacterium]